MKILWLPSMRIEREGSVRRAIYHLTIGRLKYSKGEDYDAQRFWSDRFEKHGFSFAAAGHLGFSEGENRERHEAAKKVFIEYCGEQGIDFGAAKVLDVGCGTGFYSGVMQELGVAEYAGVDITDTFFPQLREKYPHYEFKRGDVTSDAIQGSYDVVVMIDVIQHITNPSKLQFAMKNVRGCLAKNGVLVIAPITEVSGRAPLLYFVRTWSLENVLQNFAGFSISEPAFYRDNEYILAIRKDDTANPP